MSNSINQSTIFNGVYNNGSSSNIYNLDPNNQFATKKSFWQSIRNTIFNRSNKRVFPHDIKLISRGKNRKKKKKIYTSEFQKIIDLYYQNESFFLFSVKFPLRRFSIYIIENIWFKRFILLMILLNCITLSIYDPINNNSIRNIISLSADIFFQVVFTLEMLLKIFAKGLLLHKNAYLRSYWNMLDAFIVMIGFLSIPEGSLFNVLHTFRVLRPIRLLSEIGGMRVMISAVARSIPMLLNASVLYIIFLIIFGIAGVQLFGGKFQARCYHELSGIIYEPNYFCGYQSCPDEYICITKGSNPGYGNISFDNIFFSMLTLFTSITREDWSSRMYDISEVVYPLISHIYFVLLVLIGSFFIVNLNLVIISESFTTQLQKENKRLLEEQEYLKSRQLDTDTVEQGQDNFAIAVEKLVQGGATPTPGTEDAFASFVEPLTARSQHLSGSLTPESNVEDPFDTVRNPVEKILEKKFKFSFNNIVKVLRKILTKEFFIAILNRIYNNIAAFIDSIPYQTVIQHFVRRFITNNLVVSFFFFLIFLNTVAMGIDHYRMNEILKHALIISNYVFISLFTIESLLKVYGFGLKEFIKDGFNLFDIFVLIISWIEVALPYTYGFSVLRAFRMLRVLKLAKFSRSLQKILRIILRSIKEAFLFTLLMLLVIFVYSLLGMQLYGGMYNQSIDWKGTDPPRFNYDSLDWALISTFVLISAENWPSIMYQNMYVSGIASFLFFVSFYIIGNILILNLFIGLLLSHFESDQDDSNPIEHVKKLKPTWKQFFLGIILFWRPQKRKIQQSYNEEIVNQIAEYQLEQASNQDIKDLEKYRKVVREANTNVTIQKPKRNRKHRNWFMDRLLGDYSLFIFGNSLFRRFLKKLTKNKLFEIFIFILILLSALALILEYPFIPPDAFIMRFSKEANFVLTIIFAIESLLKIIANGLLFINGAYLRNIWNILDLIIVIVGFVSRFSILDASSFIQSWRLVRTLRPLRFINRFEGLKIVVDALLLSIPAIFNVLIICSINFIIFGIMGVNLFSGSFYSCSDSKWDTRALCEENGSIWQNTSIYNFDNLGSALLTLFVMSTMEGYPTIMLMGIDSRGPELAPIEGSRTYMSIYFIGFILTGSLFMTNLFVGVLIDNYYHLKNEKHIGLLSAKQQEWVDMQRVLYDAKPEYKPKPPSIEKFGVYKDNYFLIGGIQFLKIPSIILKIFIEPIYIIRRFIYRIVMSSIFEFFISVLIILNVIFMMMDYYGIGSTFSLILLILNYVFTFLFVIEAALKITAFGIIQYFKDGWNQFDFLVCFLSLVGIIFTIFTPISSSFASLFRVLRIGRAIRILKLASGIRKLLRTLFISIPSLFNVACLVFILFFVFSILGINLFGKLKMGEGINHQANFSNFYNSMLLLIRCATGEDFHIILQDAMVLPPNCSMKFGNCGNPLIAVVFFVSFMLLAMFVLLNLFVAVILENFSMVINQEYSVVNNTTIQKFLECWRRYDPGLTLYIDANDLPSLILDIGEPLAFNPMAPNYNRKMRILMRSLSDINYHPGNTLHYQEVLLRLARYKFGAELPSVLESKVGSKWEKIIPKAKSTPKYTVHQIYAAMKMQQYWRQRMLMKKLSKKSKKKQLTFHDAFKNDSEFSDLESYHEDDYDPDIYEEETLNIESDNNSEESENDLMDDMESSSEGNENEDEIMKKFSEF